MTQDEPSLPAQPLTVLQLSEARYQALVSHSADWIGRCLPDGTLTFANPALCQFLRISAEAAIGKPLRTLLAGYPLDLTTFQHHWQRVSAQSPVVQFSQRLASLDPSGMLHWTLQAIVDGQNQLIEIQIIACPQSVQRREFQEAWPRSPECSRSLGTTLPEGCVTIDAAGCIQTSNPWAEMLLGTSAEQMRGQPLVGDRWQFVQEDQQPLDRAAHPAILTAETGIPCDGVVLGLRQPAAGIRWLSVSTQPLFHPGDRRPYAVVVSFADISLQKWVEQERSQILARERASRADAEQAKERFRQLAENIQQIFWMYSIADRRMIYISPACASVLGYDGQRCCQRTVEEWLASVHPDDRPAVLKASRLPLFGKPAEVTYRLMLPDGQERWFLARAFPVRNAAGKVYRVAGIAEDITDRHRQETWLRLLESVIVHANDAVLITNAESVDLPGPRIVYINRAFTRMMGYKPEEVLGQTPRILQGPDTDRRVLRRIRAALREGQPVRVELVNYHKQGTPLWVELSIFPVADQTGRDRYWVGMQRDITDRKQAETAMQTALAQERKLNALKSRLVSSSSSGFGRPLSTILSAADWLETAEGPVSSSQQLEHIQRIQSAAIGMNHLLNDILLIEQAEAKKLKCDPIDLDLATLFPRLLEELVPPKRRSSVHLSLPPEQIPLMARLDPQLLRPIVSNLLSNALKYSLESHPIYLRLQAEAQTIVLTVEDRGIGIPGEDQARLFEPFHRATNVGNIPGNGLGLTIVRQMVTLQGGCIHLQSQVGQGTTVAVSLPRYGQAGAAAWKMSTPWAS